MLEYARTRSKATIIAEHGQEALLRPDLVFKMADGTALPARVTFSNAQGEAQGQDRKRVREESSGATGSNTAPTEPAQVLHAQNDERPAKTARTDAPQPSQPTQEEEDEDEDDDDGTYLPPNSHF